MTRTTSQSVSAARQLPDLRTICADSSPERRNHQAQDFILQMYVCRLNRSAAGPGVVRTLWKFALGHSQSKAVRLAWSEPARSITVSTHVVSFCGSVYLFGWLVRWEALRRIWRNLISRVARAAVPGVLLTR